MITLCFFSAFLFSASEESFYIMECWRQMYSCRSVQQVSEQAKTTPPFHPSHCYVVFANGTKIIDSRGFYDTGPQQEPPDKIELSKCYTVKEYAKKLSHEARTDWLRFTDKFDIQEKYSPTEMNCCTKCVDGFEHVFPGVVLKCVEWNIGCGTKWKVRRETVSEIINK